ncbi:LuxR family transcriptional regulator [Rhizobium sp. TRM95111]|uniref:helix-turn-helix transcriptional regulator n=1 Tax=Rhizobium alarense TaxID=2846851 RepID=UPI001F1F0DF7|nr:LuxR family transcriptional regulator [Rhizobium alarense]MCF3638360.1 LuxR family transcriptional regulator [Rhizobium alarense]
MRDPDNTLVQRGWSPEFLATANLESVQTEYEVLHLMRQCANHFGFSHFLIARLPEGEHHRFGERLVVSNWPAELVRGYDALGLFPSSRAVATLSATKRPVYGDRSFFAPPSAEGEAAGEAISLAERHGLVTSIAFQLHSTSGAPYILVFSGKRELARGELAELYFSAVQLFECLEKTFVVSGASREKLSSREIECLRWAAAGKSSDEIAIILGISVYTVSSYFKSATRKLEAVNRMQAIALAMRMKLI